MYRRLNEVRDYIDSCFNEDISLESTFKDRLNVSFSSFAAVQEKLSYHSPSIPYQPASRKGEEQHHWF